MKKKVVRLCLSVVVGIASVIPSAATTLEGAGDLRSPHSVGGTGFGRTFLRPPGEVTILTQVDLTDFSSVWSADGALNDSGQTFLISRRFGAANSPVVGISHVEVLFVSDDGMGSFIMEFKEQSTLTDNPNLIDVDGEWHIAGGFGKYEGLKGEGRLQGLVDLATLTVSDAFTGRIHFD
jgi:hypothetical protein